MNAIQSTLVAAAGLKAKTDPTKENLRQDAIVLAERAQKHLDDLIRRLKSGDVSDPYECQNATGCIIQAAGKVTAAQQLNSIYESAGFLTELDTIVNPRS